MARFANRDLALIRGIEAHLATHVEGALPVLETLNGPLRELLRADRTLSYSLAPRGKGVMLDSFFGDGWDVALGRRLFAEFVRDVEVGWGTYNPIRPEPAQRNVAMTRADLGDALWSSPLYQQVFPKVGLANGDQVRVLVCHGPLLLGWVGALQNDPCDARQRRLLNRLVPALKRRLTFDHMLQRAPLLEQALTSAFEAIGQPAFLVLAGGGIVHMNASGAHVQRSDPTGLTARLRDCARRPGQVAGFQVTRVVAPGYPEHFLVLANHGPSGEVHARAAAAALRWGLTTRQKSVLPLVASGLTNRVIAASLGVSESTVESHMTAILEKAQVENRAELVARIWAG